MYEKIIVSGDVIEVYTYEHLNTKCLRDMNEVAKGEGIDSIVNYRRRQDIRRANIRRLICQNFVSNGSKFLTLTFRDNDEFDIKNVKECNKEFKKFIQRLKYYLGKNHPDLKLKYVSVVEFQDKNDRGAVHYHMICNLPFIYSSTLSDLWENGFVKINRIDKVDNLGAYVIKYMTKDNLDERLQGIKAYNCSKGLIRPTEYKSWEDGRYSDMVCLKERNKLSEKKAVYFAEYDSENSGHITYTQYNLNRND